MDPILIDAALADGEVKDSLKAYGIENVAQLAKQYADTRKAYDSSIRAPGENATAEEKAAFHRKMGAPETAEGYGIPEGVGQSSLGKTLQDLQTLCHTQGMPTSTWDTIAGKFHEADQAQTAENQSKLSTMKEGWETQARAKFGDKYDTMKAGAQRIINELCGDDVQMKEIFEKTGLSTFPGLIERFAKVAAITSPENAPPGIEGTPVLAPIDEGRELRMKILEIHASKEYKDKSDPKHEIAMQKFMGHQKKLSALGFEGATDPRLVPEYAT